MDVVVELEYEQTDAQLARDLDVSAVLIQHSIKKLYDAEPCLNYQMRKFVQYCERLLFKKELGPFERHEANDVNEICLLCLKIDSKDEGYEFGSVNYWNIVQAAFCFVVSLLPTTSVFYKKATEYVQVALIRSAALSIGNPSELLLGRNLLNFMNAMIKTGRVNNFTCNTVIADMLDSLTCFRNHPKKDEPAVIGTMVLIRIAYIYGPQNAPDRCMFDFIYNTDCAETLLFWINYHTNKTISCLACEILIKALDEPNSGSETQCAYFLMRNISKSVGEAMWIYDYDCVRMPLYLAMAMLTSTEGYIEDIEKSTIPDFVRSFLADFDNHKYRKATQAAVRIIWTHVTKTRNFFEHGSGLFNMYVTWETLMRLYLTFNGDFMEIWDLLKLYLLHVKATKPSLEYFEKAQALTKHACFQTLVNAHAQFANDILADVAAFKIYREALEPSVTYVTTIVKEECILCCVNGKNAALMPCSHMVCCITCARRIDDCPVCRTKIQERIELKLC